MKKFLPLGLLLISLNSFSQDAVLPYWETVISNKNFSRADFIRVSKQAEVEILLVTLYLNICQLNLAIPVSKNDELRNHLKAVGSEIFTYNKSIKQNELVGFRNRPHEYYLSQKQTLPDDMAGASKEQVEIFCNNVRKEALALTIKKAPPK